MTAAPRPRSRDASLWRFGLQVTLKMQRGEQGEAEGKADGEGKDDGTTSIHVDGLGAHVPQAPLSFSPPVRGTCGACSRCRRSCAPSLATESQPMRREHWAGARESLAPGAAAAVLSLARVPGQAPHGRRCRKAGVVEVEQKATIAQSRRRRGRSRAITPPPAAAELPMSSTRPTGRGGCGLRGQWRGRSPKARCSMTFSPAPAQAQARARTQ